MDKKKKKKSSAPCCPSNPQNGKKHIWVPKGTSSSSAISEDFNGVIKEKEGAIPTYEIPDDFKALIEKDIAPVVISLSPLTYRDYFAALLYAEDFYMEKWSDYLLSNVTLELRRSVIYEKVKKNTKQTANDKGKTIPEERPPFLLSRDTANDKGKKKYYVVFEIDKVPEERPFLLSRDYVLVRPAGKKGKQFKGSLVRVIKGNIVLAEFGVDFLSRHLPESRYDVSFSFNRVCLKRSHQAVEAAMELLSQDILFPHQTSRIHLNPPNPISPLRNINSLQASAIDQITRITSPPPYLISGPRCINSKKKLSQTGLVIMQAVFQICKMNPDCRILITATTNIACDVLMRSLMEEIPAFDIFRANAAFRGVKDVPSDILPFCEVEDGCFTCPSLEELQNFKVILSTFVSSFRLKNEGLHAGHFSHIFLVDASSATEPETMIVLANLADQDTVVIASGSPRSCPARVRSEIARKNGLTISYFQRLLGCEPYINGDPMFITCIDKIEDRVPVVSSLDQLQHAMDKKLFI